MGWIWGGGGRGNGIPAGNNHAVGVTVCRLKRKEWLLKLKSDIIMMLSIPGEGGAAYYSY